MTASDDPTGTSPTMVVSITGGTDGDDRRSVAAGSAARLRDRLRQATSGLRTRILAWYLVLLIVWIAIVLLGARQVLLVRLADDIDAGIVRDVEQVRADAEGLDPATGEPFGGDVAAIFDSFLDRHVPSEYRVFYTLVDGDPYKRTVTTASLFDDAATLAAWRALDEPTWGESRTAIGPVRWLAVPVSAADQVAGVFVAAHHPAEQLRQIEGAIQVMVVLSVVAFLLATLLAWGAAGRAIAPLRELTVTARGIGERDLSARIPVSGTDEVAELTATLNSMLARLEAAFGSQRDFLNDVGHELRTPITIIRGHLELLDADEDPAERQKTLALVIDELDRMGRYVSDLLLIARSEQPDFLRFAPIELAEFMNGLAARVRPLGERAWSIVAPRPVVLVGDADRLTQAMVNLAVNAVRHTPVNGVIELGAAVDGAAARLWVRDEGTGIAPADQERIFERFARGRDRVTGVSEGTGLGLAIVDAIASAHGGHMELDSAVGRGSTFRLVIPLDATADPTPGVRPA